jgi:DNA-binding MurR/RpiR family transcriptional regulator
MVDTNGDTKYDTNKLTDRQQLIYNIIATADTNNDTNAPAATSASIAAAVNVSLSTVKRELDKMKDMGASEESGRHSEDIGKLSRNNL